MTILGHNKHFMSTQSDIKHAPFKPGLIEALSNQFKYFKIDVKPYIARYIYVTWQPRDRVRFRVFLFLLTLKLNEEFCIQTRFG